MTVDCPNCHKQIDLVGAKELKDEFGIGSNSVQHARGKGRFPAPWISFGNRNVWLRTAIEGYVDERSRMKLEVTVEELTKALTSLPASEQQELKKILEDTLSKV